MLYLVIIKQYTPKPLFWHIAENIGAKYRHMCSVWCHRLFIPVGKMLFSCGLWSALVYKAAHQGLPVHSGQRVNGNFGNISRSSKPLEMMEEPQYHLATYPLIANQLLWYSKHSNRFWLLSLPWRCFLEERHQSEPGHVMKLKQAASGAFSNRENILAPKMGMLL